MANVQTPLQWAFTMTNVLTSFRNQIHAASLWASSKGSAAPKGSSKKPTCKTTDKATKAPRAAREGDFMATLVSAKMGTSRAGNEKMVLMFRAPEGEITIHVQTPIPAILGRDLRTWASILSKIGSPAEIEGKDYLTHLHNLHEVLVKIITKGDRLSLKILRRKQADSAYYDHILLPETATLIETATDAEDPTSRDKFTVVASAVLDVGDKATASENTSEPIPISISSPGVGPKQRAKTISDAWSGTAQGLSLEPIPQAQMLAVENAALTCEAPVNKPQALPFLGERTLLILDWTHIAKALTSSILTGTIPCVWPTESEEIGHRIMKFLATIRQCHAGPIAIAQDSKPSWRRHWLGQWCTDHDCEPLLYQSNDEPDIWRFATPKPEMEAVYGSLLRHGAASIGATVISAPGLEASDIWGLLVVTAKTPIVGITSNADWGQLTTVDDRTRVWNLGRSQWMANQDIQINWIGGNALNGIPGLTRRRKDGTASSRTWGLDGAATLLEDPAWESQIDRDELTRNKVLLTLPCPLWKPNQAALKLHKTEHEATNQHWATYGVTPFMLKQLEDPAVRQAYMGQLRIHLSR